MKPVKKIMSKIISLFTGSIFYINGPDTLPPPLDKQAESEVFMRLTDNDPEARNTLIVHNLRLVVYRKKI